MLRRLAVIIPFFCIFFSPLALAEVGEIYQAESEFVPGTIVGLRSNESRVVEAVDDEHAYTMIGAVLKKSSQPGQVEVVTSGVTAVLVSTLNGDIKKGDAIAASPIAGVGVKNQGALRVLGIAQADFSASSDGAVAQTVNGEDGKSKEVSVGLAPVLVSIVDYSSANQAVQEGALPPQVYSILSSVSGRPVSTPRAVLALIIMLITLLVVAMIVYSSIKNGLISIGRQPLASGVVRNSMLRIIGASVLIAVSSLALVYAVLVIG